MSIRYLSASRIKTFKSCRKKYHFKYIEGLEPIVKAKPLALGMAVHHGLALFDEGEGMEAIDAGIRELYKDWPEEEIGILPDHALAIVKGYTSNTSKDWITIDIESRFEVQCGYGRRLVGYFDGIINRNGYQYILERKTASRVDEKYFNNLLWDEQASIYAFAARELGLNVSGILYDIIQKASIRQKKGETEEQFIKRLGEWYNDPSRYVRHLVTRNNEQLETLASDLRDVALDLTVAEREERWYRNPSACQIYGCPYRSICLEDTPEARTEFKIREESNEDSGQN